MSLPRFVAVVMWLKFCQYGLKHLPINQSINQSIHVLFYLATFSALK